jgi:hypothetical protein
MVSNDIKALCKMVGKAVLILFKLNPMVCYKGVLYVVDLVYGLVINWMDQ